MNALVTGIAAFFIAALGVLWPHDFVYMPALLSIIVAGGYVGGTIFSLQSEGVYDLRIRESRAGSSSAEARLGGIWAYGLVGIPADADRMKAEIHRQVSGHVAPLRLLEKGRMLMEEQSHAEALEVFRALARRDASLLPIVWQGRALKRMGRLPEAI